MCLRFLHLRFGLDSVGSCSMLELYRNAGGIQVEIWIQNSMVFVHSSAVKKYILLFLANFKPG